MRLKNQLFALSLALVVPQVQAAEKPYDVKYRLAIMEDGRLLHEHRRQSYGFRVEVVSDQEGSKTEGSKNGRPYVTALKGERYSVRMTNPLPVRVAVNLTVDGLNSITGKPSGISDGQKWVLDPYSTVTIPGWQVSGGEARRFFFTDKPKSYAKWRGDEMGKDLEANCGVIGAAFFWNQQELNQYYDAHPLYRYTQKPLPYSMESGQKKEATRSSRSSVDFRLSGSTGAPAAAPALRDDSGRFETKSAEPEEQAGTGMGERESHPTVQVNFDYNTGMYSLAKAVVIYYGFAATPEPNPFPAVSYAPEM